MSEIAPIFRWAFPLPLPALQELAANSGSTTDLRRSPSCDIVLTRPHAADLNIWAFASHDDRRKTSFEPDDFFRDFSSCAVDGLGRFAHTRACWIAHEVARKVLFRSGSQSIVCLQSRQPDALLQSGPLTGFAFSEHGRVRAEFIVP